MPLKNRKKRAMYQTWFDMKKRCLNPNSHAYKNKEQYQK